MALQVVKYDAISSIIDLKNETKYSIVLLFHEKNALHWSEI